MVEIEAVLQGDLDGVLSRYSNYIRDKILIRTAAAGARVMHGELTIRTRPPKMGRKTGNLQNAVYRTLSRSRSTNDVKSYHIGVNKKKAPHWHFLEYGTSRQPARPYIRPTFDTKVNTAITTMRERVTQLLNE